MEAKQTRKKDDKGADQRLLKERISQPEKGPLLHPQSKETGLKGASNVGEDESSGSE
jgi:hypothetical protein